MNSLARRAAATSVTVLRSDTVLRMTLRLDPTLRIDPVAPDRADRGVIAAAWDAFIGDAASLATVHADRLCEASWRALAPAASRRKRLSAESWPDAAVVAVATSGAATGASCAGGAASGAGLGSRLEAVLTMDWLDRVIFRRRMESVPDSTAFLSSTWRRLARCAHPWALDTMLRDSRCAPLCARPLLNIAAASRPLADGSGAVEAMSSPRSPACANTADEAMPGSGEEDDRSAVDEAGATAACEGWVAALAPA